MFSFKKQNMTSVYDNLLTEHIIALRVTIETAGVEVLGANLFTCGSTELCDERNSIVFER